MNKLADIFTKISISKSTNNNSIDTSNCDTDNLIDDLINQFNNMIITRENGSLIDDKEVDQLISTFKSLAISHDEKEKIVIFIDQIVRIMLCKQKCNQFNDFELLIPPYIC